MCTFAVLLKMAGKMFATSFGMNYKYLFGNEYDERTESNLIGKRDLTDERKNHFSELTSRFRLNCE